eukprot:scaffold422962_cov75-Attheya_sp.AAC.3
MTKYVRQFQIIIAWDSSFFGFYITNLIQGSGCAIYSNHPKTDLSKIPYPSYLIDSEEKENHLHLASASTWFGVGHSNVNSKLEKYLWSHAKTAYIVQDCRLQLHLIMEHCNALAVLLNILEYHHHGHIAPYDFSDDNHCP